MATKTRHHGVTYSLKRDYSKVLQVRRREFKKLKTIRAGCVTIERIKLTNRYSNVHSTRSYNQANMITTLKAAITEPFAVHV